MYGCGSGDDRVPDLGILGYFRFPALRNFLARISSRPLQHDHGDQGLVSLAGSRPVRVLEMLFDIFQNETPARGEDAVCHPITAPDNRQLATGDWRLVSPTARHGYV